MMTAPEGFDRFVWSDFKLTPKSRKGGAGSGNKSVEPVVYSVVLTGSSVGKFASPRAQRIEKLGIAKDRS